MPFGSNKNRLTATRNWSLMKLFSFDLGTLIINNWLDLLNDYLDCMHSLLAVLFSLGYDWVGALSNVCVYEWFCSVLDNSWSLKSTADTMCQKSRILLWEFSINHDQDLHYLMRFEPNWKKSSRIAESGFKYLRVCSFIVQSQ